MKEKAIYTQDHLTCEKIITQGVIMMHEIPFWWYLLIARWQDIIEIIILSSGIYYFSLWLSYDKQKPLALSLYGYCFALIATQLMNLSTIYLLLVILCPLVFSVFILLHQETIQKNFIGLHAIQPVQKPTNDWIELAVRAALTAAGDNKTVCYLIEKKDDLSMLVNTSQLVDAPLSLSLLKLITTSNLYQQDKMIWINSHTKIKGYNTDWIKNSVDTWLTKDLQMQDQWVQDALFFSTKTDVLLVKCIPTTRTYTIIAGGKHKEHLSAQNTCIAIKQYLSSSHSLPGDFHAQFTKTTSSQKTLS